MTDDYRPQMNPGNVVPAGQLPPGRELDALVAEKVLGWPAARDAKAIGEAGYWTAGDERFIHGLPAFSTDIAAAWEVVEKLIASDEWPEFSLEYEATLKWSVGDCYGATAPHAICLAALKAMGA
jgi:hypothetical protein